MSLPVPVFPESLIAPALLRFDPHSAGSDRLRPAMPLLSATRTRYPVPRGALAGFVGVQHLFGSTHTLVHALTGGLVDPSRVFLLGKPYSTSLAATVRMRAAGYRVHRGSAQLEEEGDFHSQSDRCILEMLAAIRRVLLRREESASRARYLLIDDGGRAIAALHRPEFAGLLPRFTCVEQTRKGVRELEGTDLRVPVINVAESRAKLDYESPIIARSVLEHLDRILCQGGLHGGKGSVVVIGFGSIGAAVAERLRGLGEEVVIADACPDRRRMARVAGYVVEEETTSALRRARIVVGCTGNEALQQEDYRHLRDGALLVSASSSDVEFQAWHLRALGRPLPEMGRTRGKLPCHCVYRVPLGGKTIYLANGGFPINFDGSVDPIVPGEIQLTRSLLYAGGVQAMKEWRPGLHALDERAQEFIIAGHLRIDRSST